MKVLIGTTNPSKVKRFEGFLNDCNIEFYTLKDLGIFTEPKENAIIKAKYYGHFFDVVICNDSGLYFDELPMEDSRQPGLNIRTPQGSKRLDDEEMIDYYSDLIHSLGGKVLALEGAIQGVKKTALPDELKAELKEFYQWHKK